MDYVKVLAKEEKEELLRCLIEDGEVLPKMEEYLDEKTVYPDYLRSFTCQKCDISYWYNMDNEYECPYVPVDCRHKKYAEICQNCYLEELVTEMRKTEELTEYADEVSNSCPIHYEVIEFFDDLFEEEVNFIKCPKCTCKKLASFAIH